MHSLQEKRISANMTPMIPVRPIEFILGVVIVIWVLFWKGYAVWTASKRGDKRWFIALLVLNTLSILDIFYLFYVAKKTPSDIRNICKTKF